MQAGDWAGSWHGWPGQVGAAAHPPLTRKHGLAAVVRALQPWQQSLVNSRQQQSCGAAEQEHY